ncbi:MAG: 7-cyano-7-deazaguanine synthase [Thermodesulfobacteriota bacterium]
MSLVNLVSGGLDSTLIGVLAQEEGIQAYPLFIDYGQRAAQQEWAACRLVHERLGLSKPIRVDLSGFGRIIYSGLTSEKKNVKDEAFTPGRNMLFLLMGSAYAFQVEASAVAIGLLSERYSLFPDQRASFIEQAERAIEVALGRTIRIITPLFGFSKADVLRLANEKGIHGTYSCHAGTDPPCGQCISCLEIHGITT